MSTRLRNRFHFRIAVPNIITDDELEHMNNQLTRYLKVLHTQYKVDHCGLVKFEIVRLATYTRTTLAGYQLAVCFEDLTDYKMFCQTEGYTCDPKEFQKFSRSRASRSVFPLTRGRNERSFAPALIRRIISGELGVTLPVALNGRYVLPAFK